jgi:dCMP deaminase
MRESWDSYFLKIAKQVASRSTCLATPIGAVIVKDNRILTTGYNGVPPGDRHCIEQGFCYQGVPACHQSEKPSRAIHAEANAISQAARNGVAIDGAVIYVTLQPCINCLKLCIASGLARIV